MERGAGGTFRARSCPVAVRRPRAGDEEQSVTHGPDCPARDVAVRRPRAGDGEWKNSLLRRFPKKLLQYAGFGPAMASAAAAGLPSAGWGQYAGFKPAMESGGCCFQRTGLRPLQYAGLGPAMKSRKYYGFCVRLRGCSTPAVGRRWEGFRRVGADRRDGLQYAGLGPAMNKRKPPP